jgi:hypothetical protein
MISIAEPLIAALPWGVVAVMLTVCAIGAFVAWRVKWWRGWDE